MRPWIYVVAALSATPALVSAKHYPKDVQVDIAPLDKKIQECMLKQNWQYEGNWWFNWRQGGVNGFCKHKRNLELLFVDVFSCACETGYEWEESEKQMATWRAWMHWVCGYHRIGGLRAGDHFMNFRKRRYMCNEGYLPRAWRRNYGRGFESINQGLQRGEPFPELDEYYQKREEVWEENGQSVV